MQSKRSVMRGLLAVMLVGASLGQSMAGEQHRWLFNPPPGITITQQRPLHALALQANMDVSPQFLRQIVRDPTGEAPGTLVVNTASHHLHLVRPNGWAIRYGDSDWKENDQSSTAACSATSRDVSSSSSA